MKGLIGGHTNQKSILLTKQPKIVRQLSTPTSHPNMVTFGSKQQQPGSQNTNIQVFVSMGDNTVATPILIYSLCKK